MLSINPNHLLLPSAARRFDLLIDEAWRPTRGPDMVERASPAHDVPISAYPAASAVDAESAILAARHAFDAGPWPRLKGSERSSVLLSAPAGSGVSWAATPHSTTPR